jgi:hypothetical protein
MNEWNPAGFIPILILEEKNYVFFKNSADDPLYRRQI